MQKRKTKDRHSWWHTLIFFAGVAGAFYIARTSVIQVFIAETGAWGLWGSLIVGFFFTSALTVAPAIVAIVQLGSSGVPLIPLALVGAVGALAGDLILYRILRRNIGDEVHSFFRHHPRWFKQWRHLRWFSWVLTVAGAAVIASPLPDELGLALMGLSRAKLSVLIPISLTFNAIGIWFFGWLGQNAF